MYEDAYKCHDAWGGRYEVVITNILGQSVMVAMRDFVVGEWMKN